MLGTPNTDGSPLKHPLLTSPSESYKRFPIYKHIGRLTADQKVIGPHGPNMDRVAPIGVRDPSGERQSWWDTHGCPKEGGLSCLLFFRTILDMIVHERHCLHQWPELTFQFLNASSKPLVVEFNCRKPPLEVPFLIGIGIDRSPIPPAQLDPSMKTPTNW